MMRKNPMNTGQWISWMWIRARVMHAISPASHSSRSRLAVVFVSNRLWLSIGCSSSSSSLRVGQQAGLRLRRIGAGTGSGRHRRRHLGLAGGELPLLGVDAFGLFLVLAQ